MAISAGSIGGTLLALGNGGLSVGLLVVATQFLTATPETGTAANPSPLRLTITPPPPRVEPVVPRPEPEATPPRRTGDRRRSESRSAPLAPRPTRPSLGRVLPAALGGVPALPEWVDAGCPDGPTVGGGSGGNGRGRGAAGPAFRWVHAPELHNPAALSRHYPRHAMRRGLTGRVLVAWETDDRGRVVRARIHRAEPLGVFDRKALQIVRSWRGSCRWEGEVRIAFRLD